MVTERTFQCGLHTQQEFWCCAEITKLFTVLLGCLEKNNSFWGNQEGEMTHFMDLNKSVSDVKAAE
jgi:hypothetical protein